MAVLKVSVTNEDHVSGNEHAPITLIEYGDYECPYCGSANEIVKDIQHYFKTKLRFIFRHFPLREIHPHAELAAETAEFSGVEGRFWEMHDLLYANQSNLSLELMLELATQLELSSEKLEKSLINRLYEDKVQRDFLGGIHSGVNGTPTFFINGRRFNGVVDYEHMVLSIEAEMPDVHKE